MKVLEIEGQKTWVVLAKYRPFPSVPEKSGIIRVDEFTQACVMQSDGNVGSKGQSPVMYILGFKIYSLLIYIIY